MRATSGTQGTERRSQAKGDFPLDLADSRGIAILRVTLNFPDAEPAVTPAVAGKGIIRSVEQTTTNAALSCVSCHDLILRLFSMGSTELGRLMMK